MEIEGTQWTLLLFNIACDFYESDVDNCGERNFFLDGPKIQGQ